MEEPCENKELVTSRLRILDTEGALKPAYKLALTVRFQQQLDLR